jgi:hypothetical protein
MGWNHVQGSGAQASSGSSHTLTATFSGAVAAGDLIVVSGVWYAGVSGTPTVADNVNGVNYTYKGPTVVVGTDNLGTWYYVTPKGALPGTFTITFTVPGTGSVYLAMTIDEFSYGTGATYSIDSSGTKIQAAASSISLASALSVSGTDLVYAAGVLNGSGTASPGSGFTLAYNAQIIMGQSYGIASEYLFPETSNINPTMSCSGAALVSLNGIAFNATVPTPIQQVSEVYPKTSYTWTDRKGVTKPDVTGSYQLSNLTPVSTANAGTLVITADCTTAGAIVGLALVLWDERGNPISVSNGQITASGWATNAAGNYVASQGYSLNAGYLAFDVSQAAGYSVLVIQISNGTVNLHSKLF